MQGYPAMTSRISWWKPDIQKRQMCLCHKHFANANIDLSWWSNDKREENVDMVCGSFNSKYLPPRKMKWSGAAKKRAAPHHRFVNWIKSASGQTRNPIFRLVWKYEPTSVSSASLVEMNVNTDISEDMRNVSSFSQAEEWTRDPNLQKQRP